MPKRKQNKSLVDNIESDKKKTISSIDQEMQITNTLLLSVINKSLSLPLIGGTWEINKGLNHLISTNNKFENLIVKYDIPSVYDHTNDLNTLIQNKSYFHALTESIVYQQLATKAAKAIFERLRNAVNSKEEFLSPNDILNAKFEVAVIDGKKKILVNGVQSGLSEAKSNYLKDLAIHFNDPKKLKDVDLNLLTDEELFNKLIDVKGLGPWSVHMFMMFKLLRPDVLPVGDLGFRRGLCHFQGLSTNSLEGAKKQNEIIELCRDWSPYSSLGSLYMYEISNELMKK
mmetsp:Transcript_15735/g.14238  ORF Transcript_15735/g.14238 Transcript_15735/m.14238 type:complete len:286 (-) Transcript_15735:25-882(-)